MSLDKAKATKGALSKRAALLAVAKVAGYALTLPLPLVLVRVLSQSDFVCVNCPLIPSTRGLIGAREIGLMKRSAYLINTARGPIVDEAALYQALAEGHIAGAALDVFT